MSEMTALSRNMLPRTERSASMLCGGKRFVPGALSDAIDASCERGGPRSRPLSLRLFRRRKERKRRRETPPSQSANSRPRALRERALLFRFVCRRDLRLARDDGDLRFRLDAVAEVELDGE